jgi:hypothetical protein
MRVHSGEKPNRCTVSDDLIPFIFDFFQFSIIKIIIIGVSLGMYSTMDVSRLSRDWRI